MNKVTKIAVLVVIVGATIAGLAFYATKSKQAATIETPKTVSAPVNQQPQKAPQTADQLLPLPKDNKQAIASEIKGIDDSIQAVDASLSSDTQDGELGL